MNLSLAEQDFIEIIREWSADRDQLDLIVSCKNGVWECEMRTLWRNGVAVFSRRRHLVCRII